VASFLAFAVLNSIISGVSTAIAVFSGLRAAMMGTAIATNAASAAQAAYNLVLSLNPFVLVAAAIIGLIVVLIQVYQKVDWFRDMVDKAWSWIKDVSSIAFSYVKDVVIKAIDDTVNLGKVLLDKFKAFWDENGEAIMIIVTSTFDFIKNTIQMVMGIIKGIFQAVWPIITGVVKYAWGAIQTTIKNGTDLILNIIQTVLKLLQGDWGGAWNTIKQTAQTIWDNIEGFFEDVDLVQIGKDIIR